ncbi:HAD-IC family P-type ATPase [Pseudomonas aeruginosa]|nr:HAD-IC family P-type ATPase [Pseudomonas aeruginosa]
MAAARRRAGTAGLVRSRRPPAQRRPALLAACKARGWRTLLLSGDASPMVASVAAELGIDEARGGLTPDDKLAMLERLHGEGRRVLMLGDGVNDVPVLAGADISVAMGSATDLAKTSADAVLLSNRLDSLVRGFPAGAPHPPYHHREPGLGQPGTMAWSCPSPRSAGSPRAGRRSACRSVRCWWWSTPCG